MVKRKSVSVHPSIRRALGYGSTETDKEVLADWKERTRRVCKPCWEIKYCPYGPLVEQSPLLPSLRAEREEHNAYLKNCIDTGLVGTVSDLDDEQVAVYKKWLGDDEILISQAVTNIRMGREMAAASELEDEEAQIAEWLGGPLPPIEEYRTAYDPQGPSTNEQDYDPELWAEIQREAAKLREEYAEAIATRRHDDRQPLEGARRAWFKKVIKEYDPEDHPDSIPEMFQESACNVFGHICPVFFASEAITETREERKIGRRRISFATRMRIVRRDNYTCQECGKHLQDNEVEFDHIIPVSKGGSSEEHNIRLTCYDCNRDKRDTYTP